jgi:hypothetical protein
MALTSPLFSSRALPGASQIVASSGVRRSEAKRGSVRIGAQLCAWHSVFSRRRAHLRRDRQIARYLAARGGVMTDELDRSISGRFNEF